jgi:hypothetical protein
MSDELTKVVEAQAAAATEDLGWAVARADEAIDVLEKAYDELAKAAVVAQRIAGALAVLRGQSAPHLVATQPAAAPAAPVSAGPVYGGGLPPTEAPSKRFIPDSEPVRVAEPASEAEGGVQCPGCGGINTISQIRGYKGTPYTVMVCSACQWERNA